MGLVHEFRRPRWLVLSGFVVVFVVVAVLLGFWQLRRLDERRSQNAIVASRLDRPPVSLDDVERALLPIDGFAPDPAELEFTLVTAAGVLQDQGRVLVRSQVVNGQAGTHAVYPLDLGNGTAVLVNVGWFPLGMIPPPVAELYPPDGSLELTGLLRATQLRPSFGRQEPDGLLEQVARVDVARIQEQVDLQLAPYWIQLLEPDDRDSLPVPAEIPDLDEGAHFSYAVQWFSFALIAVVGYAALVRKELKRVRRAAARRDAPALR